jgi:hypothetical protein
MAGTPRAGRPESDDDPEPTPAPIPRPAMRRSRAGPVPEGDGDGGESPVDLVVRLVGAGKGRQAVAAALRARGMEPKEADILTGKVFRMRADALRASGSKNMLWGGLICAIGTVVTVGSYLSASSGGRYVLAWGAILFGAARFLQGLSECNKASSTGS